MTFSLPRTLSMDNERVESPLTALLQRGRLLHTGMNNSLPTLFGEAFSFPFPIAGSPAEPIPPFAEGGLKGPFSRLPGLASQCVPR